MLLVLRGLGAVEILMFAAIAGAAAADCGEEEREEKCKEKEAIHGSDSNPGPRASRPPQVQCVQVYRHSQARVNRLGAPRAPGAKTPGRPQTAGPGTLACRFNYFLVVVVVGLPLPQPTTDTTLRARTKATRTRFIEVLQKV
jgi:hypothetical protein